MLYEANIYIVRWCPSLAAQRLLARHLLGSRRLLREYLLCAVDLSTRLLGPVFPNQKLRPKPAYYTVARELKSITVGVFRKVLSCIVSVVNEYANI